MAVTGLNANMTMAEQDELNKKRGAFRDGVKQDYTGGGVEVRPLPIATATFTQPVKMAPVLRQGDVEGVKAAYRGVDEMNAQKVRLAEAQKQFAMNRLDARLPTHRAIQEELNRREGIRMSKAQLDEQQRLANQQNETVRYKTGVEALVKVAEPLLAADTSTGKFDVEAMKQEQLNKRAAYNAEKELAKVDRTTNSAEKLAFLDANVKAGTGMFKAQTDREIADLNNAREWAKIAVDAKNINNNAANKIIENKREFNLLNAKINAAGTPEDKQSMEALKTYMDSVGNAMISGRDVSAEASKLDEAINNIAASKSVDLSTISKSPSDMTQLIKEMTGEAPVPMVSRMEKMDTSVGAGRATSEAPMARLSGGIDLTRQLAKFINGEKLTPEDIRLVQVAKQNMGGKPEATMQGVMLPTKETVSKEAPKLTTGLNLTPLEQQMAVPPQGAVAVPVSTETERREDSSLRGVGWRGELVSKNGQAFREIDIPHFLPNGAEVRIPLLVPTLTPSEAQYLIDVKSGARQPDNNKTQLVGIKNGQHVYETVYDRIIRKAKAFAEDRIAQGMSPFAEEGEANVAPNTTTAQPAPAVQPATQETPGVKKVTGKLVL